VNALHLPSGLVIEQPKETLASFLAGEWPYLCVPKTSSVLVTWTNVLRLLEPSTDDLAVDTQSRCR